MEKFLAIIPARGGSKRIPRKNIKNFAGQPIIKYPIDAAISSGCFDEVMVSTDNQEIASVSKSFGAKVPFMRSKENSSDMATAAAVLEEVVLEYKKLGKNFDYICRIYPTAVFITKEKLWLAKKMILEKKAEAALSVIRYGHPVQRGMKIKDGWATMIWPKNYVVRSQDLEPTYYDCAQFYFVKTEKISEQKSLLPKLTFPIEIPEWEAQDIDNESDWRMAEIKYKLLNKLS